VWQVNSEVSVSHSDRRIQFLRIFIISSLVIPTLLDFFLSGTSAARYGRVLIFFLVSSLTLLNYRIFLSQTFVGLGSLSLVATLYLLGSLVAVTKGGVFTPNFLLLFFLLLVVAGNFDLFSKALDCIGVAVYLLLLFSILAILLKLNPLNLYFNDEGYPVILNLVGVPGRNYGVFAHPNSLGQISALSVAFIASSRFSNFHLLIPFFCLFKSGSRTSIISSILILVILLLIKVVPKKRITRVVNIEFRPFVVSTLVVVFLILSSVSVQYVTYLDASGLTGRVSIWQSSLELVGNSSLIGLGWDWESRAIDSQLLNIWAVSAHNAFFDIGFATGIIGLVIFLFMYSKVLAYIGNLNIREKLILSVILISGVTESYFSLQYPNVMTFLMILIVISCHRRRLQE
jgi:O-antigen ligase